MCRIDYSFRYSILSHIVNYLTNWDVKAVIRKDLACVCDSLIKRILGILRNYCLWVACPTFLFMAAGLFFFPSFAGNSSTLTRHFPEYTIIEKRISHHNQHSIRSQEIHSIAHVQPKRRSQVYDVLSLQRSSQVSATSLIVLLFVFLCYGAACYMIFLPVSHDITAYRYCYPLFHHFLSVVLSQPFSAVKCSIFLSKGVMQRAPIAYQIFVVFLFLFCTKFIKSFLGKLLCTRSNPWKIRHSFGILE